MDRDLDTSSGAMKGELFVILTGVLLTILCFARVESMSKERNDDAKLKNLQQQLDGSNLALKDAQQKFSNAARANPPSIRADSGVSFDAGGYWLTPPGKEYITSTVLKEIEDTAAQSECDVLQVIGHTDGSSYREQRFNVFYNNPGFGSAPKSLDAANLDRWLHRRLEGREADEATALYPENGPTSTMKPEGKNYWVLSNIELGMARAVAVTCYLRTCHPKGIDHYQTYSAGEFENSKGGLTQSDAYERDGGDRRRVEIRFTRSAERQKALFP